MKITVKSYDDTPQVFESAHDYRLHEKTGNLLILGPRKTVGGEFMTVAEFSSGSWTMVRVDQDDPK